MSTTSQGYATADEQIADLQARIKTLENLLNNLLAIVHRDGGHYVVEHGLERATHDAYGIVTSERAERDWYKAALERIGDGKRHNATLFREIARASLDGAPVSGGESV